MPAPDVDFRCTSFIVAVLIHEEVSNNFVAAFGLHAALIVGERVQVVPGSVAKLVQELPRFKVRVSRNGEFVEEGSGKNCLTSPALCLAELGAAVFGRCPGEPLRAGEVISFGSLTAGHPTGAGDTWTVEVNGLELPTLSLRLN